MAKTSQTNAMSKNYLKTFDCLILDNKHLYIYCFLLLNKNAGVAVYLVYGITFLLIWHICSKIIA